MEYGFFWLLVHVVVLRVYWIGKVWGKLRCRNIQYLECAMLGAWMYIVVCTEYSVYPELCTHCIMYTLYRTLRPV